MGLDSNRIDLNAVRGKAVYNNLPIFFEVKKLGNFFERKCSSLRENVVSLINARIAL